MAAGAFIVVDKAIEKIHDGTFDLDTDTWYAVLVTDSHTPNNATDDLYSDISANEVSGGGYVAQDVAITVGESGGTVTIDAGDTDFGNSVTITAKYCYILNGDEGAQARRDDILCYVDLNSGGGSVSSNNGDFDITWNASGLFTVARA